MSSTECARLAEQHPDLASVLDRLDSQFAAMGTAEVIRPDDLASFLCIDSNQTKSALEMFAQEGVLRQLEMVECRYCQMAVLRSDYQAALDEDDEYRCTSCDRPLTDRTIRILSAYQPGEKWPEARNPMEDSAETGSHDAGAQMTAELPGDIRRKPRGFPADEVDHRRVVAAITRVGDDWPSRLDEVCRALHEAGATFPRKLETDEGLDSWGEAADSILDRGSSALRERVRKYVRYRIEWVRKCASHQKV